MVVVNVTKLVIVSILKSIFFTIFINCSFFIMGFLDDSWKEGDIPDLNGRVVLVTGATDGLGLAASKQLAKHNAHVIMTYRNEDKIEG